VALTDEVKVALIELSATFTDAVVTHVEDGNGGAFVKVSSFAIGSRYNLDETWVGFHLTYQYPEADVYPHFGAPGLALADGAALKAEDGFSQTAWGPEGRTEPVTQFSRRSNRWDATRDTAEDKLLRVLEWLRA
jgi:hypothetical protein